MGTKVGWRDRERGATITRHVRVGGTNQGASEGAEPVRDREIQGAGGTSDVDNCESSAGALGIDAPISEIRAVVCLQAGNVACIRVGTKSA